MAQDVHTPTKCMARGILLGRMKCGLKSALEALKEPDTSLSTSYKVSSALKHVFGAGKGYRGGLLGLKPIVSILEPVERMTSAGYVNREKAEESIQGAINKLGELAEKVVEDCGVRRPVKGSGGALLEMKSIPKIKVMTFSEPTAPPASLPGLSGNSREGDSSKWAVAAGVAGLIGILALVNYMTEAKAP